MIFSPLFHRPRVLPQKSSPHPYNPSHYAYLLHEFERSFFQPSRTTNQISLSFLNNFPNSPFPWVRNVRAFSQIFETLFLHYQEPSFNITHTQRDNKKCKVSTSCVKELPFCRLLQFQVENISKNKNHKKPQMLLVAPLSGHFATLLRGTIVSLLPHFDITVTSWKNAREVPLALGDFNLNTYVDYLISFCHHLGPRTHVMAICQPTVPLMIANAVMAEQKDKNIPLSNIIVAGPIDARINPTAVNTLASQHNIDWFKERFITTVPIHHPGFMRQVYPGYLQLFNFMAMNPQNHISAHQQMFNALIHGDEDTAYKRRTFYKEYKTVMDLTASFFLQTTESIFQKFELPRGEFIHNGQKINLNAIRKPHILAIEGEQDDICGIGQTKAALELTSSLPSHKKDYFLLEKAGHYGVFNGRRFHNSILPKIITFTKNAEKK